MKGFFRRTLSIALIGVFLFTSLLMHDTRGNKAYGYSPKATISKSSIKSIQFFYEGGAILKKDGSLWMSGDNTYGQLGNGTTTSSNFFVKIMDNVNVIKQSNKTSAAIKEDGSLWMWGYNGYGLLCNGTKTDSCTPIKVMDEVKKIYLYDNTCAVIKKDGSLWMWGQYPGRLSDYDCDTPQKIMDDVKDINIHWDIAAVIKENGSLWMWGESEEGILGDNKEISYSQPIKMLDNIKQIMLQSTYAVAISDDDSLYTWGENEDGRLGNGYLTGIVFVPTLILTEVKNVVVETSNISVIRKDNSLWKWGSNASGQIGDGDSQECRYDKLAPVKVLEDVKCIASGRYSVAVKLDGSLWGWGYRYDGINNQYDMTPRKKMDEVKNVYAYSSRGCFVIKEDNTVWDCNVYGYKPVPKQIFDFDDIDNCFIVDNNYRIAITRIDGSLWVWGTNRCGELGTGENDSASTPTRVLLDDEITSVTKIPGAENHYYGVNSYKNTPEGEIYDDSVAFISAMDNYLTQLRNATQKDIQTINKNSKSSAQLLKEADSKKNDKTITMDITMPDTAMNSVYETLAQYLDMYVETGVSLGKIDMSASTIEISASIVNKIRNNLDSLDFTRKIGNYTVTFKILKFMGAYTGSVTVQGNGKTYTGVIVSNSKETAKVMTAYINDMSEWVEDALYQSLKSIFTELAEVTGISDFTKKEINTLLKDKVKLLQDKGYGDLLTYCVAIRDGYDICQNIVASKDAKNLTSALKSAESIYNKIKKLTYTDEAVSNKVVTTAMNKLNNAKNKLEQSLYDYIYNADNKDNDDDWWSATWDSFKSIFIQCPVDFTIYDNKDNELGSVKESEIVCTSEIYINVDGDVKTVVIPSSIDARIEFVGTDTGDMNYVIEQTVDGKVTGRTNYYNIPLSNGILYSQDVLGEKLTAENGSALISDTDIYNPSEYISADNEDANVTVSVTNDGGTVIGAGMYAKGSPVVLTAYPDNEAVKFVGWYVNGNLVEAENVYRFAATKDIAVNAAFELKQERDEKYYTTMSEKFEELADILIYKSSDNSNDLVINMAGIDNLEFLNVILRGYDNEYKPIENLNNETEFDGTFRFKISDVALNNFSKVEVYNEKNELLGTIRSVDSPREVKNLEEINLDVMLSSSEFVYDGMEKTPIVKVRVGEKLLENNLDYTVSYSNNIKVGTASVIITGKGDYIGTITRTFTIVQTIQTPTASPSVTPTASPSAIPTGNPTIKPTSKPIKQSEDDSNKNKVVIGTTLNDSSGATYKVLTENTVAYIKPFSKSVAKTVIPPTVTTNGTTFVVSSVAKNAFVGCTKLKSVTIGKNVTSIGDKAFYNCKSLQKITIPAKVTKIGKQAFANCKKMKLITIKSSKLTAKSVGSKAFKGIYKKPTVKVPKKKKKVYKKMLIAKGMPKKVKIK